MRDAATIKPNPTQPVGEPNPRARAALSFSFEGQGGMHPNGGVDPHRTAPGPSQGSVNSNKGRERLASPEGLPTLKTAPGSR